jgi:4-amino-4-deoxy-L-arabinose transferase-like glycosyltransferase
VSHLDELIASAYLIGFLVPTVIVAVRIAFRWSEDGLDRAFLALLLALTQGIGVPLLMSMLGVVGRNSVLAGHLILAAAVLRFVPRTKHHDERPRSRLSPADLSTIGVVTAFITMSGLLALRSPSLDFDSRNYHLPHLADWLQGHSFWSFAVSQPSSYLAAHPSNGEFLGLWLALPTHGDQLSLLSPVLFCVLGILAASLLARELGSRAWIGALGATAVFASPIIYASQTRSLNTDTISAAGVIAAAALMVRALKRDQPHWIATAGVALGLGMGSKYTAMVPGLALFVAAVVLFRRGHRWLWLIPGLVIFFVPWLIRNGLHTGNPLFPQTVKIAGFQIFKGSDNPIVAFATPVATHFFRGHWSVVARWFGYLIRWLGVVPLLAAIGFVVGLRGKVLPAAGRALSLVTLVAFVGYLFTPFTGGGPLGSIVWLLLNIRYVLLALLIGVALVAAYAPRTLTVLLIAAALAYDAARMLGGTSVSRVSGLAISVGFTAIAIIVAGAAVLIAAKWQPADLRVNSSTGRARVAWALTLVVALAGTGIAIHVVNRAYKPTPLEALVDRARGSHLTVEEVGVKDIRSLLGRRLDVRLVAPDIAVSNNSAGPLDAALRSGEAPVLVVSESSTYGVPTGYKPPKEWCRLGRAETEEVYLRTPACSAAPQ